MAFLIRPADVTYLQYRISQLPKSLMLAYYDLQLSRLFRSDPYMFARSFASPRGPNHVAAGEFACCDEYHHLTKGRTVWSSVSGGSQS